MISHDMPARDLDDPAATRGRRAVELVLVGFGASVVPLDTSVNIAFPAITKSFGLPIEMIQWVVICYVLTYASLMLAFGRAGDIFSHRRVFRIGLVWNAVAFLLCAAAPTFGVLLFCRFLQGIGAGLIISCAPALITGMFPEERRGRALGTFTMMFALGSATGPLVGGTLVHLWGWPAVFWFRAPISLAGLFYRGRARTATRAGPRDPLDIAGAVLLALALSTLLLALNQLQHLGRSHYLIVALAAVALGAFIAFVRRESRFPAPIVEMAFFRNFGFVLLNLTFVLISLTAFTVLLFVPYYLVRFTGLPLTVAGAILACSFAGMVAVSPLAGRLIERIPAHFVAAGGAVLVGTALFLIGSWPAGVPAGAIVAVLLLQGLGTGLFQVSYMDLVMRTLPRRQRGVAGSLAMLTRTIGVVSGATMLTLAFHLFEGGGAEMGRFLAGFHATFHLAGLLAAATGALVLLAAHLPAPAAAAED